LSFGTLTSTLAQPVVKLRNLELAPGDNYRIVPNVQGVPGWQIDTLGGIIVNNTAIGYIPTSTGNSSNLNEAVTDPNGDVWIIDNAGKAVKVTTDVDGSETNINAGTNVTITGAGTTANPYIINSNTSGAGGGLTSYSAGSGATVIASDSGITFAKNAATGEYTFTIPEDVVLYEAIVDADISDDDGNGELFVAFNYGGSPSFNQSIITAWRPHVWIWESGGTISRASPKNVQQITVQGISSVGSGDIEITLQNITTITPNPVIQFKF
jgi:hypothetical protein